MNLHHDKDAFQKTLIYRILRNLGDQEMVKKTVEEGNCINDGRI